MAALTPPLWIVGAGAVTAAGMTAPQTCAAFRANLTGFEMMVLSDPFGAEQTVARIPAHWQLRTDDGAWIVNMAARAICEAMAGAEPVEVARTALLLTPPESGRQHPCYAHIAPGDLLAHVIAKTGHAFHRQSRAFDGGAAAGLAALSHAATLISRGEVSQVVLAGVDSLVNDRDIGRLSAANRLQGPQNSQGLIPGEGAAAVVLAAGGTGADASCAIMTIASAAEKDSAVSERFSQGKALLTALKEASGNGQGEPQIDFILSNANGERYGFLEAMLARARFFRTRRDRLLAVYPAMAAGDIGAASAALALVVASDAFARNYAPGRIAAVEVASESGLRSVAVIRSGIA